MKCRRYRKYLHLYRQGELSERRRSKLQHHLESCRRCSATAHSLEKTASFTALLKESPLTLRNPGKMTDDVIRQVKALQYATDHAAHSTYLQRMLNWFALPRVRVAVSCLVVIVIAAFFTQELLILHRISHLEKKIAAHQTPARASEILSLAELKDIPHFREDARTAFSADLTSMQDALNSDAWVLVRRSTLENLIRSQAASRLASQLLQKGLGELPICIPGVSFDDGIDGSELQILFERRVEIVEMLRQL